jgi:hypothetical protein
MKLLENKKLLYKKFYQNSNNFLFCLLSRTKMLPKIKILCITYIITLSYQTTVFTMDQNELEPSSIYNEGYVKFLAKLTTSPDNLFNRIMKKAYDEEYVKQTQIVPHISLENNIEEWNKSKHEMFINSLDSKKWTPEDFTETNWHKSCLNLLILYKKNQPSLGYVSTPQKVINAYAGAYDKANLNQIKSNLKFLIKTLNENDNHHFQDKYITICKQLWNDFLLLHNYSWLDHILYPKHPSIDSPEENKYRKNQLLLLHPDKQNSNDTCTPEQKTDLFRHISNITRPKKPFDSIINPISNFLSMITNKIIFQTSAQIFTTTCSLPSILFADYFKNTNILEYEKAIKNKNLNILKHETAIKHQLNTTKHYNNAVKRIELKTNITQLKARKLLRSLDTKN